ncbi:putative proteasome activator pa28, REG alpha beta subunit [Lyophyllum shimeji]|uniref:Proteasome activator pa28, REG alpha beta subunit n=1 Tax=Lyophyllum shimeji TaxID=47721 RepID=A0A9P3UIR7_LYOSH|nr:putative proteasome activator pa28, REG alpha beta subunit [Lyophyllum shimeji]
MNKDLAKKVEDFRNAVTKTGEDIVFNKFPTKLLELNQLVQTTLTTDSPFHLSHAETCTDTTVYPPSLDASANGPVQKKRKRDNDAQEIDKTNDLQYAVFPGRILANQHMSKNVHNVVKGECAELAAMIDQVKLWVTLTMPKIEDGDNFGVQIQEEVLAELHRAQESAYNLRDAARQDYLARAKVCSKILKYPNIEDYTLALKEHDEKQLYIARQHLVDIRNLYAVLTDLIHKNILKIRAPKANNSFGLY